MATTLLSLPTTTPVLYCLHNESDFKRYPTARDEQANQSCDPDTVPCSAASLYDLHHVFHAYHAFHAFHAYEFYSPARPTMVRLGFVARRRSPVLPSAVAAVALFATTTFAQNGGNNNNNNANTNQPPSAGEQPETTAEAETTAAAASTAAESATPSPSADADVTISGGESATQPTATATTTSQTQGTATTTGGDVQITGGTDDGDAIMTFPTIETILEIPTYAPAAVPPTLHAPFMQHSTAPEGTVFIAVGAILGAFGLGVLCRRCGVQRERQPH
ncbi:hypothetical protein BN1723_007291 [Verticillium longisporum]|uniref:Uncharacterized protein n=1 Tax=Verticillium longisporum TaxID=100787 RepID=A0A0G4NK98_VERLO|nr:hypothetical protein BN1723_007291 [Verticillium longisporum]